MEDTPLNVKLPSEAIPVGELQTLTSTGQENSLRAGCKKRKVSERRRLIKNIKRDKREQDKKPSYITPEMLQIKKSVQQQSETWQE